ncbi:MAG: sigma-54-dependent Fis family transcriptional regulator [Candidatus Marithrix sp.]|nr:sigma-54-dependent Fis family transcriptional regulator [Candidatus Marithrix sp.]
MTFDNLLGNDSQFAAVIRAARLIAKTDVTVLILGESGTGKELLAQAIHQHSGKQGSFIAVNCAALPEPLAESELFGHRKGAFTGAVEQQGKIQAAKNGTLFLDEIGELPLNVQAKLLRFLESGECQILGSNKIEIVNTRILTATNRNLTADIQQQKFRADLYYRLNIVPLELPSLHQRKTDLETLLRIFTKQLAQNYNLSPPTYSKATLKQLRLYTWPGNIRELRNFCERMVILNSNKVIEPTNLPREFYFSPTSKSIFNLPDTGICLKTLEISMIKQALEKTYGNQTKAANLLGLTRDTLLYRMKKYAIKKC